MICQQVVTVTAQVLKSGENGVMIMGLTGVAHVTDNQGITQLYFPKPYIQIKIRLHHCVPCNEIIKIRSSLDEFFVKYFLNT
jgi:hypothetical protein